MKLWRNPATLLAALWCLVSGVSAAEPTLRESVRDYRQAHETEILQRFVDFLSLPNVASNLDDIRRNAEFIEQAFAERGFEVERLSVPGAAPAVFAEKRFPGARGTLMLYAHYDGQPVAGQDWHSDPWQPVLRSTSLEAGGEAVAFEAPYDPDWRLFARSTADDKAPVIAMLAALDALEANGLQPAVNLKLFFEGEEEAGSPHLSDILQTHKDRLDADLWVFCDGPQHQTGRPLLVYGVRGVTGFQLTVFGANRPLHSGHYGNWVGNPAVSLGHIIASMRRPDGEVLIDGFYDHIRPLGAREQTAIDDSPAVETLLLDSFRLDRAESDERIMARILRPALNLKGISAGAVGEAAANAIPTQAQAAFGIRLVPDQNVAHLRRQVRAHLEQQGYDVITEPLPADAPRSSNTVLLQWSETGYPALRTPMDDPAAAAVASLLRDFHGDDLVELPILGGSLPLSLIHEALDTPLVILPIANFDNNQHGRDENLRLGHLWEAIEVYAALLVELNLDGSSGS